MVGFVVLVAFLNGGLNIVNKMVNVRAKQVLGMANGTLVNYLEGTLLALLLSMLLGERHLVEFAYLAQIPWYYYLGGFFGLAAMILTIRGMEKVPVAVSAIVILAGQLLAGFVMDAAAGRVGLRELVGLCMVGVGVWWAGRGRPREPALHGPDGALPGAGR